MPVRTRVLPLLDDLQAAETVGAAALERWIAICAQPALRGGLRVIAARDAAHAQLARDRLQALGAAPAAAAPAGLAALCGVLGAAGVSDRAKLSVLLARFPRRDADPFACVIGSVEDDETRALLDAIRDDDRLSLDWLRGQSDRTADFATVPPSAGAPHATPFLDALRAAALGSAEVFAAWAEASPLPGLRGGLRALAGRETAHAAAATARLAGLRGAAAARLDERVLDGARRRFGAADVPDEEKLALLLDARDGTRPLDAIETVACSLEADPETRELLRMIAAGAAATLAWLTAYRGAAGHPRRALPLGS